MLPSSLVGLALFLLLLAPGLAFVLRHERVVPAQPHSSFRETLRVVFVSVACLTITGVALAVLRWVAPRRTVDVHRLITEPVAYTRDHHVELAWWAFAALLFATLLGALAADPRVIRGFRSAAEHGWVRRVTGTDGTGIGSSSAWHKVFHVYEGKPDQGPIFVGAQLDDGRYVTGRLWSFNASAVEDDKRALVLSAPIRLFLASKEEVENDHQYTIVQAARIVRLDVTHVQLDLDTDGADGPPDSGDAQ